MTFEEWITTYLLRFGAVRLMEKQYRDDDIAQEERAFFIDMHDQFEKEYETAIDMVEAMRTYYIIYMEKQTCRQSDSTPNMG